jgi:hypothetical protein
MKLTSLLIALLAACLAGCSSTPTRVDKGTIHASTFSFVAAPKSVSGFADPREPIHQMIKSSIASNLAAKGLRQVPSGGDLTVAYLVIVGNNASTEAINTYFGYGRDVTALHEKAQAAYAGSKNPNYFQAGTLLVDILDTQTYKLLQRQYVTKPVLQNPTAELRAAHIQEAVNEVLNNVRIAQ